MHDVERSPFLVLQGKIEGVPDPELHEAVLTVVPGLALGLGHLSRVSLDPHDRPAAVSYLARHDTTELPEAAADV